MTDQLKEGEIIQSVRVEATRYGGYRVSVLVRDANYRHVAYQRSQVDLPTQSDFYAIVRDRYKLGPPFNAITFPAIAF